MIEINWISTRMGSAMGRQEGLAMIIKNESIIPFNYS